jgi:hypothetical protein
LRSGPSLLKPAIVFNNREPRSGQRRKSRGLLAALPSGGHSASLVVCR